MKKVIFVGEERGNKKEPCKIYCKQIEFMQRKKQPLSFFGVTQERGERLSFDKHATYPQEYYKHPNGQLWCGDSLEWLKQMEDESVDLIFADPPIISKKRIGIILKVRKNTLPGHWNG